MAALIKTPQSAGFSDSPPPQKDSKIRNSFNQLAKSFQLTASVWQSRQKFIIGTLSVSLLLICLFWLFLPANSEVTKSAISILFLLASGLFATVFAARAARQSTSELRLKKAWILLAIGLAIYSAGNTLILFDGQIGHAKILATWVVNLFYLASLPFLLAGLRHFSPDFSAHRARFWLDTGIIITGVGVALWYLLFYFVSGAEQSLNGFVLALVHLFSNFVLLFGFVLVSFRLQNSNDSDVLNSLAVATLFCFLGSVGYSFLSLAEDGDYVYGSYPDVFYAISLLFFALAAFYQMRDFSCQETQLRESLDTTNPAVAAPQIIAAQPAPFNYLSYLSVGIGYGALLFAAYTNQTTANNNPLSVMVFGAAALTAFVIARQILTVRENTKLHHEQIQYLSEKRFRSLVQNSSDAVLIIGKDLTIRYVTPSVERVFGYLPNDLLGRKFDELVHPEDIPQALGYFKHLISRGGLSTPTEWRLRNNNGDWVFIENTGNNLFHDENVRGIVINSRNVTDRRRVEDRMLHDAFHDALTGLPNRALFLDHLKLTLSRIKRQEKSRFAVLFIDLDRFKYVNDSLGHHAGDLLLIEVARRIEACLRPNDTVARLGGDEFTILIEEIASLEEVAIIAERLQSNILEPFDLDGREFMTTVSIGIALGNHEYTSAENVLRDADTAMYHAKVNGKARFAVFDQDMHARVISTMETEADLRRAIEREEFFLVYQPIISTGKYTLSGFEALVRWQHPTRGVITPDDFISLAEETGLIVPISLWILRQAGRQCALWRKFLPTAPLSVSVNISSKHFQQPDLVEQISLVLDEIELDASALKLEITESAMMENTEQTAETLKGLRALGVELSLDDFGTGYSSLSYLHRFPLDALKIDRSFITHLEDETEHFEIVRTIITLARSLGMKSIAEGVETEQQFIALQNLNCDYAQGFFFSKPLTVEIVDEMLANMRKSIF